MKFKLVKKFLVWLFKKNQNIYYYYYLKIYIYWLAVLKNQTITLHFLFPIVYYIIYLCKKKNKRKKKKPWTVAFFFSTPFFALFLRSRLSCRRPAAHRHPPRFLSPSSLPAAATHRHAEGLTSEIFFWSKQDFDSFWFWNPIFSIHSKHRQWNPSKSTGSEQGVDVAS